mmetsp:Transcript_49309/g.60568  ORF Transcript_49309/g.60568 Transcript_49309/m.60568 type:complete len:539 (+) Transcript_49309:881-2497(+)
MAEVQPKPKATEPAKTASKPDPTSPSDTKFINKLADEIKDESIDDQLFYQKALTSSTMNPYVQKARYAVRGEIVIEANKIKRDLKTGKLKADDCGYKKVVMCNIGNPQAVGQIPLTYHRQVLAGCLYPKLADSKVFSNDINDKIKNMLTGAPCGTVGAYTHSQGYPYVRDIVANFIQKRDGGDKINPMDIFLTDGASPGIKYVLQCLISNPNDAILCPIPQYPLYSASISLLNGKKIDYYLNEDTQWGFEIDSAEESLKLAVKNGMNPKGIVVINPGNPTGNCLQQNEIESIIKLARKYDLTILADEVYQENIYNKQKNPFYSFKKLVKTHEDKKISDNLELISFHSCSKGIFGECGLRGGYMELTNITEDARKIFLKFCSINLCPTTIGQCMVDLMVNPPKPETCKDSYKVFKAEFDKQYASLKERAKIISDELNKVNGIKCNNVFGAMYAFPSITIIDKAIENLRKKFPHKEPDFVYCLELLQKYGICIVPGSGFGQKKGTFHFRTTLLPPVNEIKYVVQSIAKFHKEFNDKYSNM